MQLKVRLTANTRENIDLYKKNHFQPSQRITNGYIIGKALDEIRGAIDERNWITKVEGDFLITKETLENRKKDTSKNNQNGPTTISLRQEIYKALQDIKTHLEKLTSARVHMSQIIDIMMEVAVRDIKESADNQKIEAYLIKKIGYDVKKYHYPLIGDHMDRIMCFFNDEKANDMEKKGHTDDVDYLYELLEWSEYDYFDVITSFWYLFSYGLHHIKPDYYKVSPLKNIKNAYKKPYKDPQGRFQYDSYPQLYCSDKVDQKTTDLKRYNAKLRERYWQIDKLAEITHSLACFMPVPDQDFNAVKGSSAFDVLPLMVDLIEQCIEQNKALAYIGNNQTKEVPVEQLIQWKKFLIENRERFALDQEYDYDIDKDKLRGLPWFQGQSLQYPLPLYGHNENTDATDEYEACINEVIRRVESRKRFLGDSPRGHGDCPHSHQAKP